MHPASLDPEKLLVDCNIRFTRRSGPGGQNRNKVETAVILTHRPTGITAEANEKRSQSENRQEALFRLRVMLALKIRSTHGSNVPPSDLWKSRCHGEKLLISPTHLDFPAILAEALDFLERDENDVPKTAAALGISSSQLIRLLKHEPRAFAMLNDRRRVLGLHSLK